MKIVLKALKHIELIDTHQKPCALTQNQQELEIKYCGICKTDAKMYYEGHRDLVLPRVLGHEILAYEKALKQYYVIWPGNSCGTCEFCLTGRENLCSSMRILGFHCDGGFSSHCTVYKKNLIPFPASLPLHLGTFAEPVGCVIHAFKKMDTRKNQKIVVYGGGVMGLIIALYASTRGHEVIVIEKNREKIDLSKSYCLQNNISIKTETDESNFDCAINACADPCAFSNVLSNLKKNGTFIFFSGLHNNNDIAITTGNLIHYHELKVYGSYGLTKNDMKNAIPFIQKHVSSLTLLVSKIIKPDALEKTFTKMFLGKLMKHILSF